MGDGIALIKKAEENALEDRLRLQWVVQLPYMDTDSYISFENYKARVTGADIDMRPTEEIVGELEEIARGFDRQKGVAAHGA